MAYNRMECCTTISHTIPENMSPKKRLSDRVLTIRLPQLELEKLEAYCDATKRTKTDVLREMIRKIKVKSTTDGELAH